MSFTHISQITTTIDIACDIGSLNSLLFVVRCACYSCSCSSFIFTSISVKGIIAREASTLSNGLDHIHIFFRTDIHSGITIDSSLITTAKDTTFDRLIICCVSTANCA